MKTVLLLLAISLLAVSVTNAADEWDGTDKQLHAAVGAFLGYAGYAAIDASYPEKLERDKVLFGLGVATVIGAAKETIDAFQPGNHFCGKDLVVTAVAGAVGAAFGTSIVYIDHTVFVGRTWRW